MSVIPSPPPHQLPPFSGMHSLLEENGQGFWRDLRPGTPHACRPGRARPSRPGSACAGWLCRVKQVPAAGSRDVHARLTCATHGHPASPLPAHLPPLPPTPTPPPPHTHTLPPPHPRPHPPHPAPLRWWPWRGAAPSGWCWGRPTCPPPGQPTWSTPTASRARWSSAAASGACCGRVLPPPCALPQSLPLLGAQPDLPPATPLCSFPCIKPPSGAPLPAASGWARCR